MAHRGRLYALSKHRGANIDAPYPRWCADVMEIQFPPATGAFGPNLSQKIVRTQPGLWGIDGLTWSTGIFTTESPPVAGWSASVNVWWDNDQPTHKRIFRAVLIGTFPLVPTPVTIAQWAIARLPDHRLDQFEIATVFLHDPSSYNPSENLFCRAPTWGE